MKRIGLVVAILAMVASGCGGSMTETEYVMGLNNLVVSASAKFETSNATYGQVTDPTLADLVARVERELAIEYEVQDRFEALDPRDSILAVHTIMVDTLFRIIDAGEALVNVSATVGTLDEVEQTVEFADYLSISAESDSMCPEVQAEFDALSSRTVIDDPWISDLRLTVRAFLDCT